MEKANYKLSGLKTLASYENLTLYQALALLKSIASCDPDEITDSTGIRDYYREVSFFCAWNNTLRAAIHANDTERQKIKNVSK